jgi:hypothetical protein
MIDLGIGLVAGVVGGFIIAMFVMRWAVSDLRENAQRAFRLRNQAEEVVDNAALEVKQVHKENGQLRNTIRDLEEENRKLLGRGHPKVRK